MSLHNQTELHENITFFLNNAETIRSLFKEEVDFTITDCEKVLKHIQTKDIEVPHAAGRILDHDEPIMNVIRSNKRVVMDIPEEAYGTPFTAVMVPIRDENNSVVGAVSVSTSTDKKVKLNGVAQKFASSSEEIMASTEELTVSATDFSQYMNQLLEAQNDMREQVDTTSKILGMINSVAKNTRVLGFNAGIEAARSGEHGRGFAVVAKEITRLADESAKSVKEIQQLLDDLNHKVENVATIVENTVQISGNQTTAIEEISESIQQLAGGAEEIEEMAKKL